MTTNVDVVVIGGGHAGSEAAAAACRVGARVVLLTQKLATIGEMSCNPAIGGIGKGHLVCEIDALDGLMARAIDIAGIHFKLLNRSKGPAVRGPRAQADRDRYRQAIQDMLSRHPRLTLMEGTADGLTFNRSGSVNAVCCGDGRQIACGAVVMTTGTFLRGRIFQNGILRQAGRSGDVSSEKLAATFADLGVALGRLKTGTPPRLLRSSIRWDDLPADEGDRDPEPFSTMTQTLPIERLACRITHTTQRTHDVVRANLGQSAVHGGHMSSIGPRYCPSIEDKVIRFPDRNRHQVFLEPEGLDSSTVYPNGVSTSLPDHVQREFIRTLPGLGDAEILRPGYAVEYDFVDPRNLDRDLQLRCRRGLFLAGQINGTTGYEEAAAQGLLAGLNAARFCAGAPTAIIERGLGYIGVMIDDLVTHGVTEPYRMFTSRAEYRLSLRCDNADTRLTALGIVLGVVSSDRRNVYSAQERALNEARAWAQQCWETSDMSLDQALPSLTSGRRRTVYELLGNAAIAEDVLAAEFPCLGKLPRRVATQLRSESLYAGYVARQSREVAKFRRQEDLRFDPAMSFDTLSEVSLEIRSKLQVSQPRSLAEASRLEGMTPVALAVLSQHAHRAGDVSRETN